MSVMDDLLREIETTFPKATWSPIRTPEPEDGWESAGARAGVCGEWTLLLVVYRPEGGAWRADGTASGPRGVVRMPRELAMKAALAAKLLP